jgi:ParB/RepB/Spo0J family partition protein
MRQSSRDLQTTLVFNVRNSLLPRLTTSPSDFTTVDLDIDQIDDTRWRVRAEIDPSDLIDSIAQRGILFPLLARCGAPGDKLELIAGHRRLAAARRLGLRRVPVVIVEWDDDQTRTAVLIDDLLRRRPSAPERARALLDARTALQTAQQTRVRWSELARALGIDRSRISQLIAVLRYPEPVFQALLTRRLSERHAHLLRPLFSRPDLLASVMDRAISEHLSTRQLAQLVRSVLASADAPDSAAAAPVFYQRVGVRELTLVFPSADALHAFLRERPEFAPLEAASVRKAAEHVIPHGSQQPEEE